MTSGLLETDWQCTKQGEKYKSEIQCKIKWGWSLLLLLPANYLWYNESDEANLIFKYIIRSFSVHSVCT
jgi:hypothetical protein